MAASVRRAYAVFRYETPWIKTCPFRVQDPETNQPKGYGFCEFEEADGVIRASKPYSFKLSPICVQDP